MLCGMLLVGLWLISLVSAMAESAVSVASRAKLEESIERPATRERYFRYLQRCGPAELLCLVLRVAAAAAILGILASQSEGHFVVRMVAGAGAIAGAELIGRSVGRKWSTPVLIALLPPLQVAYLLTVPIRAFRTRDPSAAAPAPNEQVVDAAIEEIRVAIQDAATEGALEADERDMIEGVLEFEDVEVHELMTPRTEMECVELNTPLPEAVEIVARFHHTRIPLYEEVRDRVVGVIRVKDLLPVIAGSQAEQKGLRDLMLEPFFVPETKRALSLLRDFKQRHLQIAIILDEYGGVTGLVTLEDVVEQIVGQLEEGFEAERIEERIRPLGGGALDVDGRLRVDEANDLLGASLPEDEDYDTVGGFMMASFASVPEKGRELRHNGVLMRVLESDDRRVRRVLLQRLEPGPGEKDASR